MQENNINYKKILIVVVPFVVFIILLFVLFNNSAPEGPVTNNNQNNINIPNVGEDITNNPRQNDPNNTSSGGVEEYSSLRLISSLAVIGSFVNDVGDVLYVEKSGRLVETSFPYSEKKVLAELPPNCYRAELTSSKNVLVLCEDGLYVLKDSRFTLIDSLAYDFIFTSNDDFVYVKASPLGSEFVSNVKNKTSVLFSLPLFNLKILGSNGSGFYFSEKPGESLSQNVFFYSNKDKEFSVLGDLNKRSVADYSQGFIFEKCAIYYDAAPENICIMNSGVDISNWRKGVVASQDSVYLLENNTYSLLGDLSTPVDALRVNVNSSSSNLLITNKIDNSLYLLDLTEYLHSHDHSE